MSESPQITFGDNVRVRPSPETETRGVAGLLGQVYGETRPHEWIGSLQRLDGDPRREADNSQVDCGIQADEHTHPHGVKE